MHRIKSMLLTFFCTGIILGAGYLVIVESGRQVLERENILEEAEYESTSANIFYGKIEENIELFPWNYYPGDDAAKKTDSYPGFWDDGTEIDKEEQNARQNWYISQLIAYESGTNAEDVWNWYKKNQKNVADSMVLAEESPVGFIYFYQDILDLNGKQYQVRLACSYWNILSFSCVEYNQENRREQTEWEEGKEKLVTMLEKSEDQMTEYFSYMTELQDLSITSMYMGGNEYVYACLQGFYWLEDIMAGGTSVSEKTIAEAAVTISDENQYMKDKMGSDLYSGEENTEENEDSVSYSYQIVELKDMILLLMQGETTLGLYYDPVEQKFCGYNYFYEY